MKMVSLRFNPYSPGFSIYLKYWDIKLLYMDSFNPYSPGFSIYLRKRRNIRKSNDLLQSLFTWIFYLFDQQEKTKKLQEEASILIHLDFLSILKTSPDLF